MVKNKGMQFFIENLKMKRKKDKKILTFRSGDLNPGFSVIFPPLIWIFMGSEEDETKSKNASKKNTTLQELDQNGFKKTVLALKAVLNKAKGLDFTKG